MVSVRSWLDRAFALALATTTLWNLLYRHLLDFTITRVLALGSLGVAAYLLIERGPDHESGDVWRFGGYTFLGTMAVSLVAQHGASYRPFDHLSVGLVSWLTVAGVSLGVVVHQHRS